MGQHLGPGDRLVRGFPGSGSWTAPHGLHRRSATRLRADLQALLDEARASGEIRATSEMPGGAIVRHGEVGERIATLAETVELFAAMAVEGAVNFYGAVVLGERYFKRHFEKLGAVPKLAAVMLGCAGIIVADDAEILTLVRRIHDRRNQLVHPKVRETSLVQHQAGWDLRGIPEEADDMIRDMERFFELLGQYEPELGPLYLW
jgi:hypothetical protein